ncbi:MAG: long-chain acyl-CoA synthetase, partial [Mucilaginibacter sp.]|nr:long-chain acyl-CoA synthetase [Mucilaginibacter sp.]
MTVKKRLFDCIDIQAGAPVPDLLNGKVKGEWLHYSTAQVHEKIYRLTKALLDKGVSVNDGTIEGRDKIGLISSGRPEWVITDLAVQQTGAILVPLYPNTTAKEIEQILIEAEVKYMFVSNLELYNKVSSIRENVPSLREVFTFDQVDGATNWETLLKPLEQEDHDKIKAIGDRITEEDIATIIYTSGTTGRPKGVMLTHKNILSNVIGSGNVLQQIPMGHKRALSFLPLNHIFEKMCTYIYLFYGFSIYYAEST